MTNPLRRIQEGTDYEMYEFEEATSTHDSRETSEACMLSVVSAGKNGNRVTFSPLLLELIGSPEAVEIGFNQDGIAVYSGNKFKLRESGNRGVIYSSPLVKEITQRFGLNFTGKTSISFPEMIEIRKGERPVAFVPVLLTNEQEDEHHDHLSAEHGDAQPASSTGVLGDERQEGFLTGQEDEHQLIVPDEEENEQ